MSVGLSNLTDHYYNYVNHQSRSAEADNRVDLNKYTAQNEFAKRMAKSTDGAGEQISPYNAGLRMNTGSSVLDAYRMSSVQGASRVKTAYEPYNTENYKIVPNNESGCFNIYNGQGEKIGAFAYADIKIRQDFATGKQFLISEHGTMSYDATVLDGESKLSLIHIRRCRRRG